MAQYFDPKPLEMSQEDAKVLFRSGGVVLFMNVPERTEVGMDYNAWQVGPRFKGIKMIPPGVHFLYYSAVSKDGQAAPRTGMFLVVHPTQIVVKEWDAAAEDAVDMQDKDQEARLAMAVREFDPCLGTYPLDTYGKWRALSGYITEVVVQRCAPRNGKIYSVTNVETGSEGQPAAADALRFTAIPKKKYPDGASPAEITRCNIDTSWLVGHMLDTRFRKDYKLLLGELQFAFVSFLIGQVFDAFEQWKAMVTLLCSCDEALAAHSELFSHFVEVLYWQLSETPEDFFIDIVSQNNFLATTLSRLFQSAEQEHVPPALRKRIEKLRRYVTDRFKWDFTCEDDDDMPVVVET